MNSSHLVYQTQQNTPCPYNTANSTVIGEINPTNNPFSPCVEKD